MLRKIKKGDFLDFLMYFIHHCFIYRVSDFNVSVDAGIDLRTVALQLWHWQLDI
jgi:hypothetical protein